MILLEPACARRHLRRQTLAESVRRGHERLRVMVDRTVLRSPCPPVHARVQRRYSLLAILVRVAGTRRVKVRCMRRVEARRCETELVHSQMSCCERLARDGRIGAAVDVTRLYVRHETLVARDS